MLQFHDVTISYLVNGERHTAALGLNLRLERGRALGIAGESGSGKTTAVRALLGILPPHAQISGEILYEGRDVLTLPRRERAALYGREISMVFQDPGVALNPVRKIRRQFADILSGTVSGRRALHEKIERALTAVHLPEPRRVMEQYPYQLSGGMKQRVALAAALCLRPNLLVADEPTTSLDAMVRKQIIEELVALKEGCGLSLLYISHDLAELAMVCDDIVILKAGKVVESGSKDEVLNTPRDPYTKALIAAAFGGDADD